MLEPSKASGVVVQTTRSHIRDVTARAMAYLSGNMMERRREIIHQWKAVADGPRNAKALADSFQARFDTAHKRLTKLAASNGWNGDISEYVPSRIFSWFSSREWAHAGVDQ